MNKTLLVLAAGLATRYGGNKQLAPVGPSGEVLLDYAVFDAVRAGITEVAFVIRPESEPDFRSHAREMFGNGLHSSFIHQRLDDLPAGRNPPANRTKPWGTAHAILAARSHLRDPFIAVNADDFYGPSAYSSLNGFLDEQQPAETREFAMIGYRLRDTLSPHGGVSRGICEYDERGELERLVEVKKIEEKDERIAGVTVDGTRRELTSDETVSMNIWALRPSIFPILSEQLEEFLSVHDNQSDGEFLMSTALNEQIAAGTSRLRVLPTRERWFGMTFEPDRSTVAERIAALVKRGDYPSDVARWFKTCV